MVELISTGLVAVYAIPREIGREVSKPEVLGIWLECKADMRAYDSISAQVEENGQDIRIRVEANTKEALEAVGKDLEELEQLLRRAIEMRNMLSLLRPAPGSKANPYA